MIALACDHGALDLKHAIMKHLEQRGLAYKDFGCYTKDSCDYPDFAGPAVVWLSLRSIRWKTASSKTCFRTRQRAAPARRRSRSVSAAISRRSKF